MILFVKKGKGMGCGCLALLLFLAFFALLIGACQEFVTAVLHKEQLVVSGRDFIANKPSEKWVKLTDVEVDLDRIITNTVSKEVFIPVLAGDGSVQILLSVKNWNEADIIRQYAERPTQTGKDLETTKGLLQKLNRNGEVEGTVRYGFNAAPGQREELLEVFPGLGADFAIIEHADKPGFGKAWKMMGYALLLLMLAIVSQVIADKLSGDHPKPSPSPLPSAGAAQEVPFPAEAFGTLPDTAKKEMLAELEGDANGGEPHALTTGLGAMKMTDPAAFLEGWTKLLLEAEVYCVGIAEDATGMRFVMTDKEDKRYLVVFTRRDLAEKLLGTTEKLRGVIPLSGKGLFPDALQNGVGLWFNPMYEICTLRLPVEMIPRFLEAAESFQAPADQEAINEMRPPIPLTEGQAGIFDHPANDLERKIVAARNRSMPLDVFVRVFLDSEAFIIVPTDQIDQTSEKPGLVRNPRIFSIVHPDYVSLCFYSHPSRSKPTTDQYPEFRFALGVKVRDMLAGLKAPCGITINPYWDIQIEWNPEQVARILKEF